MAETITTTCAIAGGGPAGMMLGFLLARAGIDVVVLEKHADFFRDFRGDTIHPSTLQIMYELGILDAFLKRPHQEVRELVRPDRQRARRDRRFLASADSLPLHRADAAMGLSRLSRRARPAAIRASISGCRPASPTSSWSRAASWVSAPRRRTGRFEVRADLVVGADGRHSDVREQAGLKVEDFGAPMDVLWFRLSKRPTTATRRSAVSRPAWCSSRSTAATIGNAPMSFRRAASMSFAPRGLRPFAPPSST